MKENLFSIKNQVIIITGGGSGIGREIAIAMANNKAIVYCFDIIFNKDLDDSYGSIAEIKVDITKELAVQKECNKIYEIHNRIDVLINNAGITYPSNDSELYQYSNWEKTLNVNLTGAFICSQAVLTLMKKNKGGSIINITSLNAELAFPKNPAYVASKGGLKMLGKAFAADWGKYGIRVNNLGPGYIKTSMTETSFKNKQTREQREEKTMLGRWGNVDDLVGPAIFLASDASRYITGQDIYIDGGWLSKGL
jgi:NAD(P)-dependent dehydrogenase (short-subunit alcohol dehydrogenase family)